MAVVSLLGSTFTTTAGAKSVTATPAVGDLILILVQVATDDTWSNPTDDQTGGTYTRAGNQIGGVGGPSGAWFVRDSLIPAATSTIFSLANPGGDAGGGLAVVVVTGMSKTGSAAVRQTKDGGGAGASTPATGAWTSAKLTTNPVVGAVLNTSNPAAITPTTGYTELLDTGYATPTMGVEIQKRDSGDTTSTMTWGSTSASQWVCIGVELDASSSTSTGNMFLMF